MSTRNHHTHYSKTPGGPLHRRRNGGATEYINISRASEARLKRVLRWLAQSAFIDVPKILDQNSRNGYSGGYWGCNLYR